MAKFRLKSVLDREGVTGYELAKRLEITPSEVYRMCKPDYNPTLATLSKVAEALGVAIDELIQKEKAPSR